MAENGEAIVNIEFAKKMARAHNAICKPLCQEERLPQTAIDILLFLVNHPVYQTAGEIVRVRKIKANWVSINVDKQVKRGYLRRSISKADRRKTLLLLTDKATPLAKRGQALQATFFEPFLAHVPPARKRAWGKNLCTMEKNLDEMLKG